MNKNEQEIQVQKIRAQYAGKERSQFDELKALDGRVRKPANVFGYVFGAVSAIIMGCGMSLVMTDIGAAVGVSQPMVPGVIIGVVGLALAVTNYYIHKAILVSRRKKYAKDIIALSDILMKG